jgi:hypothetical protein
VTGTADQIAGKIAERAAEAWYGHHVSDDDQAAVGVVAALALFGKTAAGEVPGGRSAAAEFVKADDEQIADVLAATWAGFWMRRPDLARLTMPLRWWLEDEPRSASMVRATAMVARAVVRAGLLELASCCRLHDTDVVGATYMAMKPTRARQARGEFYTPADVCSIMARMTLGDSPLEPGMKIGEPSAGTGGMLRAAAGVIRSRGLDPADFWWVANDVSQVSVAGLAVNCDLWDLGPRTVLGVADTLGDPDWPAREWEKQQKAIAWRDDLLSTARMLAAFRRAEALLSGRQAAAPEAGRLADEAAGAASLAVADIELPGAPLSTASPARSTAAQRPAPRREAAGRGPSRPASRQRQRRPTGER